MLQISNMEDVKSEWNINETHIIIPMIDGDVSTKEPDKILTSTLALSSLEDGDQTILTNALEHSLVIGLDKNLFETPNYKNDLVIIQNTDLKLLTCNSDFKNPVAYTLSYVDQDKSEILWHTSIPKHRICASDKAILEVRDVLSYDDSVHELEKSEEISLGSLDSEIASKIPKTGAEILTGNEPKKESQFINFYSSSHDNEPDLIVPRLDTTIENVQVIDNKKLFENQTHSVPDVVNSPYKIRKGAERNILNLTEPIMGINKSVPIKLVDYIKHMTDKKIITNANKCVKEEKADGKSNIKGVSKFLPEKSLPLKKKAKMKRTVASYSSENRMSLLKQDVTNIKSKFLSERSTKKPLINTNLQKDQDPCHSISEEPSIKKPMKRKKGTNMKTTLKKLQKSIPNSVIQEDENKSNQLANNLLEENTTTKINSYTFDCDKFNNIYDLVEGLRKCQIINATVWHTLNSGLKEMKGDILKEMKGKINEKYSPDRTQYSAQLKAFALMLYFKQPAAFNHLAQVYKTGWPSLNVIKEWKRRMNSRQRPNFIRAEVSNENNNF